MFWLNTDLPTRIWKLHREDCAQANSIIHEVYWGPVSSDS